MCCQYFESSFKKISAYSLLELFRSFKKNQIQNGLLRYIQVCKKDCTFLCSGTLFAAIDETSHLRTRT